MQQAEQRLLNPLHFEETDHGDTPVSPPVRLSEQPDWFLSVPPSGSGPRMPCGQRAALCGTASLALILEAVAGRKSDKRGLK